MKTLQEIISLLETAERPTLALDIAIAQALVPQIVVLKQRNDDSGSDPFTYRKFTADVSDAIWLAQTLLPGWAWRIGTCCVSDDAWLVPDFNCPIHGERLKRQFPDVTYGSFWDNGIDIDQRPSGRPAIAMCLAVAKALSALQSEGRTA